MLKQEVIILDRISARLERFPIALPHQTVMAGAADVGSCNGGTGGAMVKLLFASGTLFALLFLHPFVTYPLSLMVVRAWRGRMAAGGRATDRCESIAVCFCAVNEDALIERKVENLLEQRRSLPGLEILAYVDGATDRTAELLRRHAGEIDLLVSPERRGKTHGMNRLVEATGASIVVFTDADVLLAPDALINLSGYFADPSIGCVSGHLTCSNSAESPTAATSSLYWRLEESIKRLETDTGSAMGADGSIFAIRRQLHHRAPDDIIDDMYVSLSILCDGHRIVQAPDVRAYERARTMPADEIRRKMRIACQAFNVHRLLWPRLRRLDGLSLYKYLSHKFLRWLSIYNLFLAAACLGAGLMAAGLASLAAVAGATILLVVRVRRPEAAYQLWSILLALAATGAGVWLSMRGERFQIWTPGGTPGGTPAAPNSLGYQALPERRSAMPVHTAYGRAVNPNSQAE